MSRSPPNNLWTKRTFTMNKPARERLSARATTLAVVILSVVIAGCGGGGGSDAPPASEASTPLSITTATLPAGQVGNSYSNTLQSTGGSSPVHWSLAAGNLPAGLSLNSAGTITGTASTSGNFVFTVQAAD